MLTICVVIPCMGRLGHLQRSLPRVLDAGLSCVVVDYSCPQHSGAWAEQHHAKALKSGQLAVRRIHRRAIFSKSTAHNLGAELALSLKAEHVCFMDADTLVEQRFGKWCLEHAAGGRFHVFEPNIPKRDLFGTLLVSAEDYARSGGYDEGFRDWGMEDLDMRLKLRLKLKLDFGLIPVHLARPLKHSNALRTQFYTERDTEHSNRRNLSRVREHVRQWTGYDLRDLRDVSIHSLIGRLA